MADVNTTRTTSNPKPQHRGARKRVVAALAAAAIIGGGFVTTSTAPVAEAAQYDCTTPKLSGKLWFDADGDNVFDTGETPVEGVEMRVYKHTLKPDHSAEELGKFTTGADGVFTTPALTPGYHSVEIAGELPSGYTAVRTTRSSTVKDGTCNDGVNFPLDFKLSKAVVTDISPDMSDFVAMQWAVDQQLFSTTGSKFYPANEVRRGEGSMVVHRAAGTPGKAPDYTPFSDVASDAEYFDAVAWMTEEGLVNGHSQYTYGVDAPLTRGELAVILHRMEGPSYKPPTRPPFTDIDRNHAFYTATAWLQRTGISLGYADGSFQPSNTLTRKELAIFLQRFDQQFGG